MSKFDPKKHHRRSIRLQGYDYSQAGAYYVTVVAWHRECLFGEVMNGEMRLNKVGKIVEWEWLELPKRLSYVKLGAHMVMPNHFHGILFFHEHVGATRQGLTRSDKHKVLANKINRQHRRVALTAWTQTRLPWCYYGTIQITRDKTYLEIPRIQRNTHLAA